MFGDIQSMLDEIGVPLTTERETRAYNGYLGDTVTWSTNLTLTGSIQNLSGNEIIQAQKLGVSATHRLYVNGNPDILVNDRIKYNGIYYKITYVDNVVNVSAHTKIFLEQSDNYTNESN